MAVLDTCTLLWWTLAPEKLSSGAQKEIDKWERVSISSITIWEIGIKIKRGKLEIPLTIEEYVHRLRQTGIVEIIPVDEKIWIGNILLDWDHRDPADRTIVATAEQKSLPLVTPDKIIGEFYADTIW